MKKTFLLLALLGSVTLAQAQLRIGIKAGANFATLEGLNYDAKTRTGFHFGAIAELKLPGSFALQPELLYSAQGADIDSKSADDEIEAAKNVKFDYITVPVLLKYYLIKDLINIEVGPQFAFLVHDNFDVEDSSTFDFAALGGVGVDLGKSFFIQGRYVLGLTDASADADVTNRVIQFSLGYKF